MRRFLRWLMYIGIGIFALAVLGNLKQPGKSHETAVVKEPAVKIANDQQDDGGRQKLQEAMSRFEASPCTSELQLKNLWLLGGWVLTCENCAAVPANKIFNKAILKLADDMTVEGKRLYVRNMYKAAGQCDD